MFTRTIGFSSVLFVVTVALAAAPGAEAQEQTLDGFMAWEGAGAVYESGPDEGTFVGAISGTLFIQTEKGPAAAGAMVCPVLLEIDLRDATQHGEGKCVVTGDDGAKAFTAWTCRGVHRIGCDGEMTLTGGSGRLQGITGKGALSVRTINGVGVTNAMAGGAVAEGLRGLLTPEEMTYSLPQR